MAKSKYATDQYKNKVRIIEERGNIVKTDKGDYHKTKLFQDGKSLATKEAEEKDGVWRTVRGRHVFIEEGKTLEQALGHKPGVENQKKIDEEPRDYAKERREKIFKANAKKYKKDFAFRKQK